MPDRQRRAVHHAKPFNRASSPTSTDCGYPYGFTATDWADVTCNRCLQERPTPPAADTSRTTDHASPLTEPKEQP